MSIGLLVAILSIGTAIICFFLGLIVLGRDISNNINFNFCIFAWLVALWEGLSYAFYLNQDNFQLYKFSIVAAAACLLMIAPWVLYLVENKPNWIVMTSFYIMSFVLITVPFWDKNVMSNFSNLGNMYIYDVGVSYYIYAALVFLSVGYSFYLLIKNFISSEGLQRTRILFVLIGMIVYVVGELVMGVILPLFKLTPSVPYDNFGAVFFVIFSSYAILKVVPVDPLKSIV